MDGKMNKKNLFKERKIRGARVISKAQGLVEFALVLPVILITLFVLVELARVLHAWMAIENGARAGVRYAVTAEFNPDHCPPTGCTTDADEAIARVDSIHDAAWAGSSSIVRVGWNEAAPDEKSYFNVIVCDPEKLVVPASTFDTYSCQSGVVPSGEDPGNPGEQVVVVVEFNHPLLSPLLTSIWPQLRLNAVREATVETYRVPQPVGTAPLYNSPTPRPTNTPAPTNTPPGPVPPPSCSQVWVSSVRGDPGAGWFSFEVRGYPVGELYPGANYLLVFNKLEMSLSRDAKINKFDWMNWNEGGGSSTLTTTKPFGDEVSGYFVFVPSQPHVLTHCYPGGCSDYHYRGKLTTQFDRSLGALVNFKTTVSFPDYDLTCSLGWRQYKNPSFPTETREPYISNTPNPNPEPSDTPTEPWVPPVPSDTPEAPPD